MNLREKVRAMMPVVQRAVSAEKVQAYETAVNVFGSVFAEVKQLARKKPEATLNPAKVRMINKILVDIRLAVEDEPEVKYLELLDEEMLPQMSDAVIIMAQYEAVLECFRARHFGYDEDDAFDEPRWFVEEDS